MSNYEMTGDGVTPKLSSAQRSFLKRLYLSGGTDALYTSSYSTAVALSDKGMITIEIINPVKGRVSISKGGERVAKAIIALLEPKEEAWGHEH